MDDDLFSKLDPSRREFLKRLARAAFVAPLLLSFSMDGLSPESAMAGEKEDHDHEEKSKDTAGGKGKKPKPDQGSNQAMKPAKGKQPKPGQGSNQTMQIIDPAALPVK
jgi:hypothetical protein